ncbi:hypothetical protein Emtol_3505 [Emticicia oligotrophica DSM 17448]|uniref:Uncharacterized protein n=1 Tax=Emticicia oligotrophica (strain DSM 17448 / CIP 109782 / MTCC 6937 / GPTSA100-15) TaxID=929562 RepID=A0ABN4AQG4_EMTOG|nr:hypothetical protein [Emticicia oligotrophica]AFK04633.1 hypothetical protein Emtol_3505 [Emticicia oligotrophica DSM 17448]
MKKTLFWLCITTIYSNIFAQRISPSQESIETAARLAPKTSVMPKSHIKQGGQPNIEEFGFKPIKHNNIIPMGQNGTIMSDINSDEKFTFVHTEGYDRSIKNIWQNDFKIDSKYDFIGEQSDSLFHYAMFNNFLNKNKITLLKTSIKTGIQQKIEGSLPDGIKMFTFRVVGEDCFVACKYKERPVVMIFHDDGTFKVLPNLLNKNAQFLSLYADNESFTVILKQQAKGTLLIKKYSKEGFQLSSFTIPNDKKQFNEAKTIRIGGKLFVIGTYTKGLSFRVRGLYTACLDENFSPDKVKYTEFSEFSNLLNQKQKAPPYAIVHQLKLLDNGKSVMCVFDFFDANISNQEYTGKVKYQYSMICKFNNEAQILWNSVIALDGLTSYIYTMRSRTQTGSKLDILESNVKPAMQFLINKNRILGGCQFGNVIYTNLLDSDTGEVVAKGMYEEAGNEQITGFLPWFDDNFLVWGRERRNLLARPSLYMRKMKIVEKM